jgi:xyloglucan-specific exo-beta-1,4-glucanase
MSKVSRTTLLRAALLLAIGLMAVFAIKIVWGPDQAQAHSSQTYQWNSVPIGAGGVIQGIVFNPTKPNLLYTRTDIGGAYRWDQSTQSWIPLMDFTAPQDWNLMGVDSLATDPVDPNRLYILAGTYTNEWTNQNGAILRSMNRGNSFQRTDLPFKAGGNMPGSLMGERLAIDPNRNSILYLGARSGNGLWRSTDFGETWSKVSDFPNPGTYFQDSNSTFTSDIQGVVWVTFDKRSSTPGNTTQTIYVGVADKGNSVYRSTDGGTTWVALPGQPTGFLPHHGVMSATGMLYISYSDGGGPFDNGKGDVWRFNPANGTWTNISPVPSSSSDNNYGYGGLAVDAQNPNTLMVAALNSWWPDTIIFRSLDGGVSWTRIWDWAGYPNRTFRYVLDITSSPWLTYNSIPQLSEVSPKLGWIVGTLAIDPFDSNRMMYGSGATLFGTTNLTNWDSGNPITLTPMVKGLEHTAILDLISPPSGAHLISGVGDICGFRHDDLNAVPARMMGTPTFGNTTSLDYAERSPNFVVRVGNTGNNNVTRAAFSSDGGTNWFQADTEPAGVTAGGMVAAAADARRVVWSPDGAAVSF